MRSLTTLLVFVSASVSIVAYSFQNFETKEHTRELANMRDKQLEAIDKKLDKLGDKLDLFLERE